MKQLRSSAQLSLKEERDMLRRIYRISPPESVSTKSWKLNLSYVSHLSRKFATIAILVGLTGGIGITAAADNSLPNGVLYPIKITITEPVRELTRFTPESKVAFQKEIINRRFEEATTLAATGELDTEIEQALATKVQERIEKVKNLNESIVDVEDKLALSTELKNIIETKSNELASVIENNEDQESTKAETSSSGNKDDEKKVESTDNEPEKTSVATSSLLAIADVIVKDINIEQSETISDIAKEDPNKALELSKQVYKQEFLLLSQEVSKNLETARTNILSLQLLIPEAATPTPVEPTPVVEPEAPSPLPTLVAPTTPDTVPAEDQPLLQTEETVPKQNITDIKDSREPELPISITNLPEPVAENPLVTPTEVVEQIPLPVKEKTDFEKYQELEKVVAMLDQKVIDAKKLEPSESSIAALKDIIAELQNTNNKITNIITAITAAQENNVPSLLSSSISTLSEISTKENEIKEPSITNLETQ